MARYKIPITWEVRATIEVNIDEEKYKHDMDTAKMTDLVYDMAIPLIADMKYPLDGEYTEDSLNWYTPEKIRCDTPVIQPDVIMVLCMVRLEDGLDVKQINTIMDSLPAGKKYMLIEFHENNTSAYGFIESEYYSIHDYVPDFFAKQINAILDDMNLENSDGMYLTPDGRQFYMGYFKD